MQHKKFIAVLLIVFGPLLLISCGGGGGGGGSTAGLYTIDTSGGDGGLNGGFGGTGGNFLAQASYSGKGPVEIRKAGKANASFTPSTATPDLGDIPLSIATDTTIAVVAEPSSLADGTPYLLAGDSNLYIARADIDDEVVTGVSVAQGATLTLELNLPLDSPEAANIFLINDIDNQGTITVDEIDEISGGLMGDLDLVMHSYFASGEIHTTGQTPGQFSGNVHLELAGSCFNKGSIITSGQDNDISAAGHGGSVEIHAVYQLENTGSIITSGGDSVSGRGGNAGGIQLEADDGSLWNSGDLIATGGAGALGGGNGGSVTFYNTGGMVNSGTINCSGGDSSGGAGGDSGSEIRFLISGGDLITSGNLIAKGGSTTDAASSGGNGGAIIFDCSGILDTPAGNAAISGNINTSGGDAVATTDGTGDGGQGGAVEFHLDAPDYPLGQRLALFGYKTIDTHGGSGNFGANAGNVELYNDQSYDTLTGDGSGGDVINEADIIATGGDVLAGAVVTPAYGGYGGFVDIYTEDSYGLAAPDSEKVVNRGAIDSSSGANLEADGSRDAGAVQFFGYNGVNNSGPITANGGSDPGDAGAGNSGAPIGLFSESGQVKNTAALSSCGGDGEYLGGNGYIVELFGNSVVNTGDIIGDGGDADPLVSGSVGGDGATVDINSLDGLSGVTQTGTVSNAGGDGETPGTDGEYYLGGVLQ